MADLLAEIRERLDTAPDHANGVLAMRDALLAALNVHKPERDGIADRELYNCGHCRNTGWGGPEVDWPCPTVCAIAEALGIEVDCG